MSCLRGRGEEAAAASADRAARETESDCCKAFVQKKVRVLNPLTGKSVGVKTPTSPTGATPLPVTALIFACYVFYIVQRWVGLEFGGPVKV